MVKKLPYFSVILCNYNYGRFIKKAIKSVLSQTFADFELIIVDDGSKDNSNEVINEFDDQRIKKIFKPNGGQASAFNDGFKIAKGEIVAFLDSDDWWETNKLQVVLDYYKRIKCPISIIQHLLDDSNGGKTTPYKNILPSGDVWNEMKQTNKIDFFIPTSGLCIPKNICDKIFPIPTEFWYSADAFLMRTAIVYGNVFSIPQVLGYHRVHENTFTNTVLKRPNDFLQLLLPQLNAYYASKGIDFQFDLARLEKNKMSLFTLKKHQVKNVALNIIRLLSQWK